jgi:hypothetical protein
MATEQYLDSIIIEYYNGSAWVDISAYVVGDIKGNNGLGGWKPDQRVAVLGTLNITLNNKSKLFTPMGGDAARGLSTLTGWNKGSKVRVRGLYRGFYYTIWTGRIASIDSDDLNWGNEQVRVMAVDYMNVPSNYPMQGTSIATSKRIDEAMTLILARLSLQPEATDFDTGSFTFPAVFDNVKRKTMALSEFTKLANSELGYIYVKQDGTLAVENTLARQGWRALETITVPDEWIVSTVNEFLLMEDSFFLLLEDGGKILVDDGTLIPGYTENASLATDAEGYNIFMGEDDLLNASIIRAYPVITDTSLKVLYKLGTPLFIPAGQTSVFSAHYTDPNGGAQISGGNMQVPAATTDYLANSLSTGLGTNYTANVVVTATYYGDVAEYSIANNAAAGVYMTFLQARGYGIYYGNSIESMIDDATSQATYGYAPFQFDMKYQKDTYLADMYGKSVVEEYKNPKSRITKMNYLANLNANHMMSFLMLSIGSLILGTEDRSALSNHYYITDRAFTIKQGGIVNVEYGVKQNDSYLSGGLNPLNIEFNGTDQSISYAQNAVCADLVNISVSTWVYIDTLDSVARRVVSKGLYSSSGWELDVQDYAAGSRAKALEWWYGFSGVGGQAGWKSVNSLTTGLHFLVVTYNNSSTANAPIMYVDGASVAVTVHNAATGTAGTDKAYPLEIGGQTGAYFDGKIFDPRVYNRILTAAEVTTLYNGGTPLSTLVTTGLVFQGMATYTDRPLAAGTVLTSTDRLTENILRAVGIPNGSPTIRANP